MGPLAIALVAGGAIQGLGALAQYYQSEKARKANKQELDKIEDLYNKIAPPDYDLTIFDPPSLHQKELEKPKFASRIKPPEYYLKNLTQKQLSDLGRYTPQLSNYIKESAPELLKETQGTRRGREAQIAALERLAAIGAGETDPEYQELVNKSISKSNQAHRAREESALQDLNRRGMGGSGLSLLSSIGSNAAALETGADIAQSAATQAYKNRLNALMSGAELGGRISAEDYDIQRRNNETINDFNRRMATNRQAHEEANVGRQNEAERYNQENYLRNLRRQEDIQREGYGQERDEREREDRIREYEHRHALAERDRQDQIAREMRGYRTENRDFRNRMRRQEYQDVLARAAGAAGRSSDYRHENIESARDRNAAIQGVANAASNIAMAYGESRDRENRRKRRRYEDDEY